MEIFTMKLYIVAILFAVAEAIDPDCVAIRYINYEKEVLLRDVESPYQLAIDHDTNTLFFSYTARTDDFFKSVCLSLKTHTYAVISGIRGGFANAVNSKSGTVYLGGEDGIYQYNYDTKTATNLHLKNDTNVWQMFYKDGLYFTTYPEEKAYFYKDQQVVEVPAFQNIKVMLLALTNDKNFVYVNSSGVYMHDRVKDKTIHLSNVVANGITSDIDGNIYLSSPNGIYYYNDELKEVEYLAKLDNIYGVALENNGDIIYASEDSIIRLKPTTKSCNAKPPSPKVVEIVIGQ